MNKLPEGWYPIDMVPPNKLLKVIDSDGKTGLATPTYYPFKVVPNPNKPGKWGSDVIPCEEYWDGGWLIEVHLFDSNELNDIIGWRE
jgi:hypothetical protein